MVVVSYSGKEINAKLVYYGAGLCGKTTNLEAIYEAVPETSRGKMVSMKTQSDRTLFFDLLPLDLGEIMGFKTRFLLYTVPGQVFYNATRKLVLKGADALVFVADSGRGKMDENKESLNNLRTNLGEYGLRLEDTPWVLQFNKRDLPDVYTVEEMNAELNPDGKVPFFEAVATQGTGVFETFRGISHLLMQKVTRELQRTPQGGARAARNEEAAIRAAERRASEGAVTPESHAPSAGVDPGPVRGLERMGERDPFAPPALDRSAGAFGERRAPAAPSSTPAREASPEAPSREEPSLAFDYSRDLALGDGARGASPRAAGPAAGPDDGSLDVESEPTAATRAGEEEAEDGEPLPPPVPRVRFEERTLTLGAAARAATASAAPAERQEISIPVRVPAGGSRQIVVRITIESEE